MIWYDLVLEKVWWVDEPMDGWKDIQTDRWTDERFSARIATAIKRKGLKEI